MEHYHFSYREVGELSFPTLLFMLDGIVEHYGAGQQASMGAGRQVVEQPIDHFVKSLGL